MPHITPAQYKIYYEMWKAGRGLSEIRELVQMSEGQFKDAQPYFLHHCRQEEKEAFRQGMTTGTYKHMELSPERKMDFLHLVAAGVSYDKIAKIMDVPLPTVMDVWLADSVFKDQVETMLDLMNAKVMKSLFKKAVGTRYITKSVARTRGQGEKGHVDTTTVTKTEKVVEGDFNAQKFWLINRLPKEWSPDGFTSKEGNKGKILAAIEAGIGGGSSEGDNKFEQENDDFEKQPERLAP